MQKAPPTLPPVFSLLGPLIREPCRSKAPSTLVQLTRSRSRAPCANFKRQCFDIFKDRCPHFWNTQTHTLGSPRTVVNMSYGSLQNEDYTSISRTCTQLHNEVRKLRFDQYVPTIKPALSMRRKSLRAGFGSSALCNPHEYGTSKIV